MGVPPLTIQPDGSDESRIVIRVSRVGIILTHARLAARRIAMVAGHLSRLIIADPPGVCLTSIRWSIRNSAEILIITSASPAIFYRPQSA